jgi:hypothetical protein
MVTVCVFAPENEEERNQWDYVLLNFKPDNLYVIGNSAFLDSKVFKKAHRINFVSEIQHPGERILFSSLTARELRGRKPLREFSHPEDVIYFFGPNNHNLSGTTFVNAPLDEIVYIPTNSDDEMYSWNAYCIGMWDRVMKSG